MHSRRLIILLCLLTTLGCSSASLTGPSADEIAIQEWHREDRGDGALSLEVSKIQRFTSPAEFEVRGKDGVQWVDCEAAGTPILATISYPDSPIKVKYTMLFILEEGKVVSAFPEYKKK